MPLVKLVEGPNASAVDVEMVESGRKQYGKLLNTWKAILNKPGLFATYLPFLRKVAGPGVLDQQIKDLSALLVGHLNNCPYTVSHRVSAAIKNGATTVQVKKLVSRNWDGFEPKLVLALKFTEELTLNPTVTSFRSSHSSIWPETLSEIRHLFSDEEIVELAMSVSIWNGLSRFHRVMEFELDMPKPPKGLEPK